MISRLTAFAATFAVLVTASLAFAASSHLAAAGASAAVKSAPVVVQLERVVVVTKRLPKEER